MWITRFSNACMNMYSPGCCPLVHVHPSHSEPDSSGKQPPQGQDNRVHQLQGRFLRETAPTGARQQSPPTTGQIPQGNSPHGGKTTESTNYRADSSGKQPPRGQDNRVHQLQGRFLRETAPTGARQQSPPTTGQIHQGNSPHGGKTNQKGQRDLTCHQRCPLPV